MSSNNQPMAILLVEDDEGHRLLVERNLRRSNILNPIVSVSDGQQALDYIFGKSERGKPDPMIPMLVLLDLNLPVLDGYQVLKRLKSDKRTKLIPVVILTSTEDPREVSRCYELGCNVYVPKPMIYGKFSEVLQKLGQFLSIVCVPESNLA
ncbi:MAG TPA: response regulator [Aggregatilineales bacterium]|nr:response regulator [Aggregatilineales bacterium]